MTKQRKTGRQEKQDASLGTGASWGTHSVSETPKYLKPENTTAKDLAERKIASEDAEEREEALLDEAIEETFPASDPISLSTHEELQARWKNKPRTGDTK